jgi:hypothetical protein
MVKDVVVDEPLNFAAMTREVLIAYAKEVHEVDLDLRKSDANLLADVLELEAILKSVEGPAI